MLSTLAPLPARPYLVRALCIDTPSSLPGENYKPGRGRARTLYYATRDEANITAREYSLWGFTTWIEFDPSF